MNEQQKAEILSNIVYENEIQKLLRTKKLDYIKESHDNHSTILNEKIDAGWEIITELKTKTQVSKPKPYDVSFEDKVWSLFALMGFKLMNKDRHLFLPYDKKNPDLTHQIEVFAKDDETMLIINCSASPKNKAGNFETLLESVKSRKQGIINTISALFPHKKPKFKYILATRNLALSPGDELRLKNIDGVHFSEEIIEYYYSLTTQIGIAVRYQLLGGLFAGQDIPDLENKIPAIEGKMGGHTYYSFSIEPEKLLKIGYVLHRNKAHENMMPTYQRLIKKSRLKEIHNFVDEEGGYFPNSIIINIVLEKNKKIQFEKGDLQVENAISRIGILHLPRKYRSAYIIDGQHRLYGYSNSQYKSTNTIPVVALINLDRAEQVKLFMQINENQKPVSKDLRNTLDADLLWESDNWNEKIKALKSRIAIHLGEDRASPFFEKVSIGEDKKIISTQQIAIALSRSDFLGKVKSKEIEKYGTFFQGDMLKTYKNLTDFLVRSFSHLKSSLENIWEQEGNIIVINKGFYGITMILNDIINHLFNTEEIHSGTSPKQIFDTVKPYLDSLITFYQQLNDVKANELKTAYGTPGDAKYWRTLQVAVKTDHPRVHFEGLEDYLKKEEKENNELAFKYIREIENFFKADIRSRLEAEFDKNWFKKGVPEKIYGDAINRAAHKNREIENEADEKEPWDQLHLIDYREIVTKNWQKIFEPFYTKKGEEKSGNKDVKTKWMEKLNRIRNENSHTYYVTTEELSFIEEIYDWLISKRAD